MIAGATSVDGQALKADKSTRFALGTTLRHAAYARASMVDALDACSPTLPTSASPTLTRQDSRVRTSPTTRTTAFDPRCIAGAVKLTCELTKSRGILIRSETEEL